MILRIIFAALILGQTALLGQNVDSHPQSCISSFQFENLYSAEVWRDASPPELTPSVIVISVSTNSESKVFLRARDNKTFELVQGSLKEPLAVVLKQLKVPTENPHETAKLLPIEWETKTISAQQFSELHDSFIIAFAKFIDSAKKRYRNVLIEGGRMTLHNTQYQVAYENDGYESFAATVDDVHNDEGEVNPIVAWVHQLLTLSQEVPQNAPKRN